MPYNTTPITPAKEITGSASLPLARVKKIIASDPDVSNCSNNAAFMITVAAEMFIQHLVEQSYNVVKSERKPRRNIQYRDVANAVARVENLEFLTDVVPKTMTWKQYKQKQAAAPAPAAQTNGQLSTNTHLDLEDDGETSMMNDQQATNGASHDGDSERMDVDMDGPTQQSIEFKRDESVATHDEDDAPSPSEQLRMES